MPSKRRSEEFYDQVASDFPDGFLASFDTPNRETRAVLHVIDIDVNPNSDPVQFVLDTAEDLPGKVFEYVVTDYEVIENNPTMARVTVEGSDVPMIWSDNIEDDLRMQMRGARGGGTDLSDEEDPPLRTNTPAAAPEGDVLSDVIDAASAPEDNVEVTPEQAEDPDIAARVAIGDILELEDDEDE